MPDSKYEDRLKDYVDVKERIRMFYEAYSDGRLVTERVEIWGDDDTPRIVVKALAYRTPDDPHPGSGWSWMVLPGSTSYTRGSELENTETSAWGRAIGSLGIGITKSIASADEVAGKSGEDERKYPGLVDGDPPEPARTSEGGLIGNAVAQGRYDFNIRMSPATGWVLPFRIKAGSKSFGVVAEGALAEALDLIKADVIDKRVTVWGHWTDEVTPGRGLKPEVKWRLLHVEKIETPDAILPATLEATSASLFPDEAA